MCLAHLKGKTTWTVFKSAPFILKMQTFLSNMWSDGIKEWLYIGIISFQLQKKKIRTIRWLSANNSDYTSLVHLQGLEPWAHWLRVSCSTNWAKGAYICGAWHRFMYRRGAPHRLRVVIHPRFEPGTPWLKVTCSANWANGPKNGGWGGRIWTYECGNQNPVPYRLATPQ